MEKLLGRRISVFRYVGVLVACVASVSARVRRENWDGSNKREMKGKWEGREGNATQARGVGHMGVRFIEVPLFHYHLEVELGAISTLL